MSMNAALLGIKKENVLVILHIWANGAKLLAENANQVMLLLNATTDIPNALNGQQRENAIGIHYGWLKIVGNLATNAEEVVNKFVVEEAADHNNLNKQPQDLQIVIQLDASMKIFAANFGDFKGNVQEISHLCLAIAALLVDFVNQEIINMELVLITIRVAKNGHLVESVKGILGC